MLPPKISRLLPGSREQCVMLSQLRLWDGKHLTHKMGQLPDDQFEVVKQALRRLLK